MPWYDDSWRDTYDAWKLASPYDDGPMYEEDDGPLCLDCDDVGFEIDAGDHAIPCTCCSAVPTLEDFDACHA